MSNLPVSTPKELLSILQRNRGAIEMALPKHLNPDRMMRLGLTCFSTNPHLRECSAGSILSSIVVASQLGLEPGIAGQGYLIPYKTTCTFVPGWQGLVGLLNNTGRATAWTGSVFDGDEFECELGSNPRLRHKPGPNYGDATKLKWVYAVGKVNGSEQPVLEPWPIERVWKHRDRFNKVGAKHYSFQHPEMYARKVVLLQVLKYMPRSIELNNAIAASDAADAGNTTRIEDGVVIEVPTEIEAAAPASVSNSSKADDDIPFEATASGANSSRVSKPGASASPSQPPPSSASNSTAQNAPGELNFREELAIFVTGKGYTFDEFKQWGVESGNIQPADADMADSFALLPEQTTARFLRAKAGLIKALAVFTGREPRQ